MVVVAVFLLFYNWGWDVWQAMSPSYWWLTLKPGYDYLRQWAKAFSLVSVLWFCSCISSTVRAKTSMVLVVAYMLSSALLMAAFRSVMGSGWFGFKGKTNSNWFGLVRVDEIFCSSPNQTEQIKIGLVQFGCSGIQSPNPATSIPSTKIRI